MYGKRRIFVLAYWYNCTSNGIISVSIYKISVYSRQSWKARQVMSTDSSGSWKEKQWSVLD